MGISPELWAVIIGQSVGIAVSVGVYLKTMNVIEQKIDDLEKNKLDLAVHEVEVVRIDGAHQTLAHRVSNIDQRVNHIETRR